jgi:hypothetical protein
LLSLISNATLQSLGTEGSEKVGTLEKIDLDKDVVNMGNLKTKV